MAYTEALLDTICERVLLGESLRSICQEEGGMPDEATASRWLEVQADTLMDEAMDLADGTEANPEAIAEASAKIDDLRQRVEVLLDAVPAEYTRAEIGTTGPQ